MSPAAQKRYSTIPAEYLISGLESPMVSPEVVLRSKTDQALSLSYETIGPELIDGQVVHHYADGGRFETEHLERRRSTVPKNPFGDASPSAGAVCKVVDLATIAMLRYVDRLQQVCASAPQLFEDAEDLELTGEGLLLQQAQLEVQNCAYVMQDALCRARPNAEAKPAKPRKLDGPLVILAGLRSVLGRVSQASGKLSHLDVDLTGLSEAVGWAERKLADLSSRCAASAQQSQRLEEQHQLQRVFGRLDSNHNGVLEPEEFASFCDAISAVDLFTRDGVDCEQLFRQADTNRDGAVDVEEFCGWVFGYLPTVKKRKSVCHIVETEAALVQEAKESAEEARRVTKVFTKLDADASGELDREEFRAFLALLAEADASGRAMRLDVDAVMAAMDTDGDGKIDLDEFRELLYRLLPSKQRRSKAFDHLYRRANEAAKQQQRRAEAVERLRAVFKRLDADGNGTLDAEEFRRFFSLCAASPFFQDLALDLDLIVAQVDTDGNGVIDIDEFCDWVFSQLPHDKMLESLRRDSKEVQL